MTPEEDCRKSFFEKIRDLPAGDLLDIRDAYGFIELAHRRQFRDGGEPYIPHCAAVASLLFDRGYRDKDIIIVALGHDVVEDTDSPTSAVIAYCGHDNWKAIDLLSKNQPIFSPFTGQLLGRRNKSKREYFGELACGPKKVRLVKPADRVHNMRTMDIWPKERRVAYAQETQEWILPIADATDAWFAEQLRELVKKELG